MGEFDDVEYLRGKFNDIWLSQNFVQQNGISAWDFSILFLFSFDEKIPVKLNILLNI